MCSKRACLSLRKSICDTAGFVNQKKIKKISYINRSGTSLPHSHRSHFTMTIAESNSLKSDKMEPVLRLNNIQKSEQDTRDYRGLQLKNGLKALLISDPDTDVSAAALSVQVGHMSDPEDLNGLAHFCEHMLFLGTQKYPSENGYTTYLSQNGGSSNAATYPLSTKYHFHIAPEALEGALDRFASFFIAPLFTSSATEREINAVNSEHEKNLSSDLWRIKQVHRHLAKPDHAYSKFGSGNKSTLYEIPKSKNIDLREELLKFHKNWYSANIMCLAVIGKESLNKLEEIVVDKFSEIENKNVQVPNWPRHPFADNQYGQKVMIVPIKDIRSLTISFTTDDLTKLYKSGPDNYVTHLIGHEGKGSILSELRRLGWCNDLMAGHQNTQNGFGFFEIVVDLTQEGLEHVDDVVNIIFQYLNMLREDSPKKWIFDECVSLNEMRFRFKEKEQPENLVIHAATSMQIFPLGEVLIAPYLSNEWRPDLIRSLLDELIPSKCRISIVSQRFEKLADLVEPYYKTRYYLEGIPLEILHNWENCKTNANLDLPLPNNFIPTNFDIADVSAEAPKHPMIIVDTPILRVWHKQDNQFKKPKACMTFDMSNPISNLDPLNCNLNHMIVMLLKDQLNEYLYDAELASLILSVITKPCGIDFTIRGFNDKQVVLLEKLLDHLFDFRISEKRFDILKEEYTRSLKNFKAEQPYQHSIYYLALLLTENAWANVELLDAMELVSYESIVNFAKDFFQRLHTECFIFGNVTKQQALAIAERVNKRMESTNACKLPILARQMLKKREYKLLPGDCYLFQKENEYHKSSCTQLYLQCGAQTDHTNIMVNLVSQVLSEPCYDCLRTKEQLGYIVFSGVRKVNGANGIRIIVQSTKHPSFVENRIEHFLQSYLQILEDMSLEEFQRHKESLAVKKLEKPKTLFQQFSQFYGEIAMQTYHFEREEAEVAILRKITKEDLIEYFKNFIAKNGKERRMLSVYIISTQREEIENRDDDHNIDEIMESHESITDIVSFKSSKELYPIALPFLDIKAKGARSKL
ncbi:insulin-degrading enzyme [Scaptodrosophila lebanonensis]|uniref:Insulin-degrading enzyme n=1 Tax=Drosophila lebanonensis TaxID=7225 RepID=A0A6J2U3T7_DROLE|nr:insulin-degrading enzyme [Scaptodrosophila lebanonensis]